MRSLGKANKPSMPPQRALSPSDPSPVTEPCLALRGLELFLCLRNLPRHLPPETLPGICLETLPGICPNPHPAQPNHGTEQKTEKIR